MQAGAPPRADTVTISHINISKGFRGGERQTELLIRHLAATGLEQELVLRRNQPLAARLSGTPGLTVRETGGNAIAAMRATRKVNIIHAHESRAAHAAYLRHRISGTPYVITRRVSNVPRGDLFTRRVYRQAAKVVCVASSVGKVLEDFEPAVRTSVIHSAISELPVDQQCVGELRDQYRGQFLVGHVGALDTKTKGLEEIIQASRDLEDSHPDIVFLLIGGGADENMLRAAAGNLANVRFTGFVDNVGDYLSILDCLILPSRMEGIGGILLDGMQFGLPVVASRVGGLPEIVKDGDNGLLIEPRDPGQVRDAILRLYGDEDLRRRMGERGRQFVSNFAPDKMAARYLAVYESILGRSLT